MLVCRHCGWENPDEAAFCTNCGRGLARGRAITTPDPAGGRFRALGSPVVTVQPSEPPKSVDPPLPRLKPPAAPVSAPTLLDFRMPEQMLAELSRMRGQRTAPARPSKPDATDAKPLSAESPAATPDAAPVSPTVTASETLAFDNAETLDMPVSDAPAAAPLSDPPADLLPVAEPPESMPAELVSTAAMSGLGDIARALRAEASPPDARPTAVAIDPPTLDPGEVLPEDEDEGEFGSELEGDDTDGGLSNQAPPPGVYADAPVQELPFFESESDGFSEQPASAPIDTPLDEPDGADLPFVLGPDFEVEPPLSVGDLAPGASVDLLPPDGSVDLEQSELAPATTIDDLDEADGFEGDGFEGDGFEGDGFEGLDEPADAVGAPLDDDDDDDAFIEDVDDVDDEPASDEAEQGDAPIEVAEPLDAIQPDDDLIIEDADGEAQDADPENLLNSGDMEAVVLTTQTNQPVMRAAPPPMPAAASTRFVLRPLSENLDASFLIAVGDEPIDIGRLAGDLCFEDDTFLSPLHARFEMADNALQITDLDSLNGVWIRVREEVLLPVGATFLCGQQVIEVRARASAGQAPSSDGTSRFGAAAGGAIELAVMDATGDIVATQRVPRDGLRLGRRLADMVFTDDAFMSSTHASVRARGEQVLLRDLDSRNGTWLRLTGPQRLRIGDAVMLGRTVLRVGQPSG